jgi:hypothetical protein
VLKAEQPISTPQKEDLYLNCGLKIAEFRNEDGLIKNPLEIYDPLHSFTR